MLDLRGTPQPLGRYRLLHHLDSGPSSLVQVAEDRVTGDRVVVKILERTTSDAVHPEIAALQMLDLPEIVSVIDEGVDVQGRPFLVTPFVEGQPFPGPARHWAAVKPIVISLLRTLRCLHANGIVHRDLKPEHVLVTPAGRPVLVDFGIALGEALGRSRGPSAEVAGTLRYISPEQLVDASQADPRSDLYTLGLMVAEALTGQLPHDDGDPEVLRRRRLAGALPAFADVPDQARMLLQTLLQRRRLRRPASADEALRLLGGGASVECDAAFAHWADRIDRSALERLFSGPERLFHLRSDASGLLWHQCDGDAPLTARVLTAWIQHGLAHWDQGALTVSRTAINRLKQGGRLHLPPTVPGQPPLPDPLGRMLACVLLGWPDTGLAALAALTERPEAEILNHCGVLERMGFLTRREDARFEVRKLPPELHAAVAECLPDIHQAIAAFLPPNALSKLHHLASAGSWSGLTSVAVSQARLFARRGELSKARIAIDHGLRAARKLQDIETETSLLEVLVTITLAEDTPRSFDLMLHALGRASKPPPRPGRIGESGAGDPYRSS